MCVFEKQKRLGWIFFAAIFLSCTSLAQIQPRFRVGREFREQVDQIGKHGSTQFFHRDCKRSPQEFVQTERENRGRMTFFGYRAKFSQKTFAVWVREMPDGKIEQYQLIVEP